MTREQIEARIAVIEAYVSDDDPEIATVEEMRLKDDFIAAVASGQMSEPPFVLAKMVLATRDIKFRRTL